MTAQRHERTRARREFTVRRDIRLVWRRMVKDSSYRPASQYLHVASIVATEKSDHPDNARVHNWVMIIEELLYFLCITHSATEPVEESTDRRNAMLHFLIGAVAGHLNALRLLVTNGFDVQARILCRTLSEQIDILLAVIIIPELCDIYQRTSEPDDANRFWHTHVARGKLRKKIIAHVGNCSGEALEAYRAIHSYIAEEEQIIGAAVYPSYISAVMVTAMGCSHGVGGAGMFGVVDTASVRTLTFAFYRLIELMLIGREGILELIDKYATDAPPLWTKDELLKRFNFVGGLGAYISVYRDLLPLDRPQTQEAGTAAA